jgi:Icc-related predicted phosphoesterase
MDILVIGDNHNDIENNFTYIDKLKEFKFDVVLHIGDFTDANPPKGFTQKEIAKIIIEELRGFKKPIMAVPGNNDTVGVVKLLEKEEISLHGKGIKFNGYGFYGFGGAKTPYNTNIEPTDEETKTGLENGFNDVKNIKYKIQLTHNPPKKTKIDMTRTGSHVGSEIIRGFIEEKEPLLAVSGHIHESRGVDVIGKTFIMNPGRLPEGYFGLINTQEASVSGRVLDLTYQK